MKSVRTTIRVFEAVAAHQPIGLSELARRLDVPKASVQRALHSLKEAGWLRQDRQDPAEPGRWVVSARFALLADAAPAVIAARERARQPLEALRAETGLPVALLILDGDHMTLVGGLDGSETLRAIETTLGPLPVHVSAGGRAILSRLPAPTRREVLDRALRRYTPQSLTDPAAVLAEVARAERDGYAVTRGEFQPDTSVVAAAVLDSRQLPVAAVAVFVPEEDPDAARIAEYGRAAIACAISIFGVDPMAADLSVACG
ncbi:MAG TPA: IclR family transcriptional regulator [Frankiaceae bacterium]|nr:IclR family transcriptional regulator [Frankiaceae bacterium]